MTLIPCKVTFWGTSPQHINIPVHAKSLQSCPTLCDPMDCTPPGSSVYGFSRWEYWSGLPCAPPGDRPDPGINPRSLQLLHCRWILYCWVTGEAHMNMGGTQFNHRDVEVIHSTLPTQWKETISLPVFPCPVNDIEFPLCPGVCLDVTCVGKPFLVHYPHVNWY